MTHCMQLSSKYNQRDEIFKKALPKVDMGWRRIFSGSFNVFCLCLFIAGMSMDRNLYRLIAGQITVLDFLTVTSKEMLETTVMLYHAGCSTVCRSFHEGKEWCAKMMGEEARSEREGVQKQFPPGSIGNPLPK